MKTGDDNETKARTPDEILDADEEIPGTGNRRHYKTYSSGPNNNDTDKSIYARKVRMAWIWVLLAVVYFIMPDIIPGPIDDIAINAYAIMNLINKLNSRPGRDKM